MELSGIFLDLFLIFMLARLAAELFERIGQPVVIAELLVGVAIGPHALSLIGEPSGALINVFGSREGAQAGLDLVYQVVAQLGLIVLLFYVGLQTDFERLIAVLPRSVAVAVPGVALTMVLGTGFMLAVGYGSSEALFTGAAIVATSAAVTARVLDAPSMRWATETPVILGAAVLDDVLSLLVLAAVSQTAREGGVNIKEVALVLAQASAFALFVVLVARHAVGRYSLHLERLRMSSAPLAFGLALMLGLSAMAAGIGLAGLIGAFFAGLVLSESSERLQLGSQVRPIYEFLTPFFFVFTGATLDMAVFNRPETLLVTLGLTAIAIAGKVIGCGLGAWGTGLRSMAVVAVGMVPRGEIGFAVASIGLGLGVLSDDVFSAVVFMSIATALLVPAVLRRLLDTPEMREALASDLRGRVRIVRHRPPLS